MDHDSEQKVRNIAFKISFLMEHQRIVPELMEIAYQLCPEGRELNEYNKGAFDALTTLILALEKKGC